MTYGFDLYNSKSLPLKVAFTLLLWRFSKGMLGAFTVLTVDSSLSERLLRNMEDNFTGV